MLNFIFPGDSIFVGVNHMEYTSPYLTSHGGDVSATTVTGGYEVRF
jgi:hypothetical protein